MYTWVEHTAEIELRIEASTEEALLGDALAAFAELVGGEDGEPARPEIVVSATEPDARLVAWIEELVFLAETQDFVPERAAKLDLRGGELRAEVEGRRDRPAHLVKAVTYHDLEVAERDDGWHARVVLDV